MLSWKIIFARIHDVAMAGIAMLIAVCARYGLESLPASQKVATWVFLTAAIAALVFYLFGLGRGMWRFASISDAKAIFTASAASILLFLIVMFLINRLEGLPRTVPLIAWFVMVVLLAAPRLAYRLAKNGGILAFDRLSANGAKRDNILIFGTASQADTVIRTYDLENSMRFKVHGIIDYSSGKQGRNVRGIPIVGDVSGLDQVLNRLSQDGIHIDLAILAGPSEKHEMLGKLFEAISNWNIPIRRISNAALTEGEPDLEHVRLTDLLGRPPVKLNTENLQSLIAGKVIAVTGAGGSIGSEIVRQVAEQHPSRLILIDNSEHALYQIDRTIRPLHGRLPVVSIIADIRNRDHVRRLMMENRPSIVFHAAALKHVPMVEANVCEGVHTNVIGTRNVADAAIEAGADAMVMISTDKATRPASLMGASKRVAEAYCQALDASSATTRFMTVRFGNVLGSTGSVVPLFKEQIGLGGPVTVTHPEMRRYFMTIEEATTLVLQSAAVGISQSDQRGCIFVLDMGEPVRIVDLARTLIALAGMRPEKDIPIVFTGLRPGEKLSEELFDDGEEKFASGIDRVFVASARVLGREMAESAIGRLEQAVLSGDDMAVRAILAAILPNLAAAREPETSPLLHGTGRQFRVVQ